MNSNSNYSSSNSGYCANGQNSGSNFHQNKNGSNTNIHCKGTKGSVYVLSLTNAKWYVGKTSLPVKERFLQHVHGQGAAWTSKYRPIKIYREEPLTSDHQEDIRTIEMMREFGIHNVRGGIYCETVLSSDTIHSIKGRIAGLSNACMRCFRTGHFVKECREFTDNYGDRLERASEKVGNQSLSTPRGPHITDSGVGATHTITVTTAVGGALGAQTTVTVTTTTGGAVGSNMAAATVGNPFGSHTTGTTAAMGASGFHFAAAAAGGGFGTTINTTVSTAVGGSFGPSNVGSTAAQGSRTSRGTVEGGAFGSNPTPSSRARNLSRAHAMPSKTTSAVNGLNSAFTTPFGAQAAVNAVAGGLFGSSAAASAAASGAVGYSAPAKTASWSPTAALFGLVATSAAAQCCTRCFRTNHTAKNCYASTDARGKPLDIVPEEEEENVCFRCSRPGHFAAQCYATTDVDGQPLDSESEEEDEEEGVCFRCGRAGHFAASCYAGTDANGNRLKRAAEKDAPRTDSRRRK